MHGAMKKDCWNPAWGKLHYNCNSYDYFFQVIVIYGI